ncbi:MAG: hypothetical protein ACFB14_26720 [Leptolyngbyaceae cyanobacterium]
MTPKEELMQVIEQSPDELIRAMLDLIKVMQLDSKADVQQQSGQVFSSAYPLRGLPLTVSEDFDEPMPELWEALEQ